MKEALPDLVAHFSVRRGLFRKERVEAELFELDSYGCVMKTDKMFNPGDTVVLDLIMDMPFDKIRAENLSGLVTERRKHCSNFFYSIDFSDFNPGGDAALEEKLRRIREVLSKKQSLKSRRSSGSLPGFRQMA
ncbi:hypothetical protein [Marinobacter sp. AC-23]|uniref:hypothetical protein n=1 Tax=Marinobacter sp. AC-23 TaxID=1879031 RepID=UPI0008DD365D|nr:hypothetical protein [Marinobacter sp. AC-23]OHY82787.1 hypothetical protein BCA33_00810 [Marinobacter sp. AC-23]